MAISHAFTNRIPDGTNTNIVRPSDWNSAHNQYYTLSGNTLGVSTVSGTNVVLQGGGNVSLSGTGQTVVVYGGGGGTAGGAAISAGTQFADSGTVSFANSNGISFGMSDSSRITASYTVPSTTGLAGTGFTSTTTTGTNIVGTLSSNGLSLGVPAYVTNAAGGGVAIAGGTQTATSGTVIFSNSNNITFGMSGSSRITASFSQSVQTQASGNIAGTGFTSTTVTGSNILGALGTDGLSLSVPLYLTNAAGGSSWTVSDNATSGTVGRLAFTNLNGVTLSLSTGAGGSHTIVGSHNGLTSQSNQAFSASGGSSAFQTLNFANSNGVTFSNSNGSVIASHNGLTTQTVQTQASGNIAGTGFTSTTTAGTAVTGVLGTDGISLGIPNYLTALNVSNTATSVNARRLMFEDANGLTFGISTNVNSATITASYTVPATTGFAGTGFTSTTTTGTAITAALGTNGLSMAIPAYLTAAPGGGNAIGVSGGANSGTAAAGTVYLATGNGISFGFDAASSQITASYAFVVTDSATSSNIRRLAFSNSNGVSFGISTGAGNSVTLTASHDGLTNINVSAGTTSGNLSNVVFSNSNGVSFGLNGSTITASAVGGGGAMYANLSGNTSGNTTASGSTLNLSGINITLSGTNNSQIAISAPATSSLSAGNNITITSNGSTIGFSAQAVALAGGTQTATSGTVNFANSNNITFGMSGSSQITASFSQSVQTQASGNIARTGFTSTTTTGTAIVGTLNTSGLSLGVPAYLTAAAGGGIAAAAGTQTATSGTIVFSNSNNITFGMSGSSQITASFSQSVQTQASGNIAGTGFASTTIAGTAIEGTLASTGLSLNVPNYLTALNVSNTATSVNARRLMFQDSNGLTFGISTNVNSATITASYTVPATTGFAGTGFTSTTTTGTAITAALGTNGLSMAIPAYITAAAGAGNAIAVTQAGGGTTAAPGTVQFATGGGFTFGFDAASSQITLTATLLTVSDGALSTGVRRMAFSNSNGVSFGFSTNAQSVTLTASHDGLTNFNVSAGTTSNNLSNIVFSNSNGVTFGLSGSTVTASVSPSGGGGYTASGYSPHADYPLVGGQVGQGTLAFDPDLMPDLTFDRVALAVVFSNNSNSTGSVTISNWVGLYTKTSNSLSLHASTSTTNGITFSGTVRNSIQAGWRNLTIPWSTSVSEGRYWIAQLSRTTTAGANASYFSQMLASQLNTAFSGIFGAATANSDQYTLGQGFYSASTSSLPNSIAFSEIYGTNSLAQRFPVLQFAFSTY